MACVFAAFPAANDRCLVFAIRFKNADITLAAFKQLSGIHMYTVSWSQHFCVY